MTAAAHGGPKAVRALGKPFKYSRPGEKTGPMVLHPRDLARRMLGRGT